MRTGAQKHNCKQKEGKQIRVNWSTLQEQPGEEVVVERKERAGYSVSLGRRQPCVRTHGRTEPSRRSLC